MLAEIREYILSKGGPSGVGLHGMGMIQAIKVVRASHVALTEGREVRQEEIPTHCGHPRHPGRLRSGGGHNHRCHSQSLHHQGSLTDADLDEALAFLKY